MKNKILLIIIGLIIAIVTPSNAVNAKQKRNDNLDEVVLEDVLQQEEAQNAPQAVSVFQESSEKSLKEKLQDVYHLEVDKYDKPTYLLKDVLTQKFEEGSLVDHTQLWAGYNGDIGLQFTEAGVNSEHTTNHYDINTINVGYDGFLKNNNGDFRIMINISPYSERNVIQNLFADMYIATNKIPHHRLLVGHSRPPVGMEGAYGPFVLPFIAYARI